MSEELLEQAAAALDMARQSGADEAVVHLGDSGSTEFSYRDGKLEDVKHSASRGLSVQLYVDGRYSSHSTTDLRTERLGRFIAEAVAVTRCLEPDPDRVIPEPELYEGRADLDLDLVDEEARGLERDTCLDWLGGMDAAARADQRVISATSEIAFGWRSSAQVSSNGFEGARRETNVGYGSMVNLDEGDGRRPEAYRYVHGHHLEDLPAPVETAAEALQRALDRLGSRKAPSGRGVMVVVPEAGAGLLGRALGALYASSIQQNRSFLAGKKDQPIGSDRLSLIDEPHQRRGPASRLYDGEGIATRRRVICEGGVLRDYYVDTYYGRKLGWPPTTGSPTNLVFETAPAARAEGESGQTGDLDNLIAAVGEGFCIDGWLGGNADLTSGDFSLGIRGHRIANGQKAGPISEMNITGNYLSLLGNLAAVGSDPYPFSSAQTPTLVFEDVEFSGQ